MQAEPKSDVNGAPSPAPSTEKTYYQPRAGVRPTTTSQVAFANSAENGQWPLDSRALVMSYTEINGYSPQRFERGIAPNQETMGAYNNSFKPNL